MQGVGVQQPVYTRGEQEWSVVQSEAETRLVTYNHAPVTQLRRRVCLITLPMDSSTGLRIH